MRILVHSLLYALLVTWWLRPDAATTCFRLVAGALFVTGIAVRFGPPLFAAAHSAATRLARVGDLLLLNLVAILLTSELFLRAVGELAPSPLLAPTDAKGHQKIVTNRLAPGEVYLGYPANAQGFYDDPFVVARTPGTRRIVVLADSFGVGVVPRPANFATRLDDLLDQDARGNPTPTEVLNLAVRSLDPHSELELWRSEGARYQPDQVLLCFFIGNDFTTKGGSSLLDPESFLLFSFVRRFVALQRELVHASREPAHASREPAHASGGSAARDPPAAAATTAFPTPAELPSFSPETFRGIELGRLEICRRTPSPKTLERFTVTFAQLDEMVQTIGARLRVALIPDEFQVEEALFTELAGASAAEFDRELPNRRLAAFFAERSIPCLDLLPALREAETTAPTYRPLDTHWNDHGNAVAAVALARWLTTEGR